VSPVSTVLYSRRMIDFIMNLSVILIALFAAVMQTPQPAPEQQGPVIKPQPAATKGTVIRGCLNGSKLTHIEVVQIADPALDLPDVLRVSSIRVIKNQVKALSGHQVELIGSLRGIPGQDRGLLVGDSGAGRVYIGGATKHTGDDQNTGRIEPATIYANTIKDLAATCESGAK
jgi:hypothetical protein